MKTNYKPYRGVIVPLVTPLTSDFKVDSKGLCRLLDHILETGIQGFLLAGTTGEAVSLEESQKTELLSIARRHTGDDVTLFAGIGGNCLAKIVDRGKHYLDLGIDAVVAHTPFYYPLSQSELHRWFELIADQLSGPLLLYNIPQTTHQSLDIETIEALSRHPGIHGVKDSEFKPARLERVIKQFSNRDDFDVYIGPTTFAAQAIELGAKGFIPSLGNVLPAVMHEIFTEASAGNHKAAQSAQERATVLNDLYLKGQPVGNAIADLKCILELMSICEATVCPPLVNSSAERREFLKEKTAEFQLV